MSDLYETTGRFATENAQRYMTQLCKHFAHKVPAAVEGSEALVEFPKGRAKMHATPTALEVIIATPDAEAVGFLRAVIDDHLVRFAFREEFTTMTWSDVASAA